MAINIINKSSTHNTTAKAGRTLAYIVIHYTAGTSSKAGSAANSAAFFATTTRQASADFIVDDSTIIQYNPDVKNRYCWHCGDGLTKDKGGSYYGACYNSNSIGIEVCCTNKTGTVTKANDSNFYFTDAAIAKAKELTEYLMNLYGIPKSRVIRHYDVSGKLCPGVKGWNEDSGSAASWTTYKNALTATVSGSGTAVKKLSAGNWSVYGYSYTAKAQTPVYCDTSCKTKIGSLGAGEKCYGIDATDDLMLVWYALDDGSGWKCGYAKKSGAKEIR